MPQMICVVDHMDISQVDPELQAPLRMMPPLPIGNAIGRRVLRLLGTLAPPARVDGVVIETIRNSSIRLRAYRPKKRQSMTALFWIHGGGYVIGQASLDDRLCSVTADALGILVVSIDYRLAPEHPFPAGLDDCHAAWQWLQQRAYGLEIDPSRVAIGGESAGGGLAASLAQRLHDEGSPMPAAQWLISPMLDDRTAANRELDAMHHFVWNNRLNDIGWRGYLGVEPGAAQLPAYASPARRDDLTGMPPTWIGVGEIDLFHQENLTYAARLRAAGVEVVCDVVPGAPHGFSTFAPDAQVSRDFVSRAHDWLRHISEAP
jgi:acetyl esterase/lipase